jgi:hypothetical protein
VSSDTAVNCDLCNKKLNEPTHFPADYYLRLSQASAPSAGGFIYDVCVYPLLKSSMDFCGFGCLKDWLEKEKK